MPDKWGHVYDELHSPKSASYIHSFRADELWPLRIEYLYADYAGGSGAAIIKVLRGYTPQAMAYYALGTGWYMAVRDLDGY